MPLISFHLDFTEAKKGEVKQPFKDWWILGVVGAVLFLLLLILLIICCVKQNKGEAYYGKKLRSFRYGQTLARQRHF